jgi:hypothetical protein
LETIPFSPYIKEKEGLSAFLKKREPGSFLCCTPFEQVVSSHKGITLVAVFEVMD